MSLLLDALKKAAEQKAEKSKKEETPARGSDETLVDAADEVSTLDDATDVKLPQEHRLQDETEIENSELETRLERTLLGPDPGEETGIDAPDATETEMPGAGAQMRSGEDETIIFAEDDVADFMGEPQLVQREPRAPEDETDLSQLAPREDETDLDRPRSPAAAGVPGDEADLSRHAEREDETDLSQLLEQGEAGAPGDETGQGRYADREDETDLSLLLERGGAMESASGDETGSGQLASGEQTETGEAAAPVADETDLDGEDKTDISEPIASVADLERVAAQQADVEDTGSGRAAVHADEGVTDDDMSLLLVDRDQTNLTNPTSATDPQRPQDQIQALQEGAEELALVDTTENRAPPTAEQTETVAAPTQTGATVTAGTNYDTQGTTRRAETTSTRTYAPDNYDRTLMRLPSDDASKLFAGMKSDSDVVMTPDYAKKVFQSKSSAQRMQHYKFYAGIAVVILLGIGVYGLFEFQEQSNTIDASLQPLKRDPMPGVVRTDPGNTGTSLFNQVEPSTEVSERTISIIESAEQLEDEDAADAGLAAAGDSAADAATAETAADAAAASTATRPVSEPEAVAEVQAGVVADEPATVVSDEESAIAAAPTAAAAPSQTSATPTASSSTLEIASSSRIQDKDRWLHQAYQAYRAGDDELALELYNKVLEVDPVNRNALLARAAINVQNNEAGAAIEDYQALLAANPKDSLAMSSLISVANYSPRETETRLKLMLREEPDSPYLNFALANAYGAQDRWREAQGHYFTALQNNPGDPNYAYNLAVSLEHIAQPRAAMTYYQRALDNMDNGLATFNRNLVDQRLEVLGKL